MADGLHSTDITATVGGADLWEGEGGHIQHLHQGVCQITEASHLAVLPDLGLGQALPLPLIQPQGGQVDHHMLPLVNAGPVSASITVHAHVLVLLLHANISHHRDLL